MTDGLSAMEFDINDFLRRQQEAKQTNTRYLRMGIGSALFLFAAGLVAMFFGVTIGAVVLLAVSAVVYQSASHYRLRCDMQEEQWYLALLVNDVRRSIMQLIEATNDDSE